MTDHHFRRACVFIDGENFRHSICDLLEDFEKSDYLPKHAQWDSLFLYLAQVSGAMTLLRTYWYVVGEIDFRPYNLRKLAKDKDSTKLVSTLRKSPRFSEPYDAAGARREQLIAKTVDELELRLSKMRTRFEGWRSLQNGIASGFNSVEFRRAGSIPYDLFEESLGAEKGVDVKLATDLITLQPIYDVAIIVSGDGDYVPAVQAIKDAGKHVVNVSFLRKSGRLLPGGAWRLNLTVDQTIELPYDKARDYLITQPASAQKPVG